MGVTVLGTPSEPDILLGGGAITPPPLVQPPPAAAPDVRLQSGTMAGPAWTPAGGGVVVPVTGVEVLVARTDVTVRLQPPAVPPSGAWPNEPANSTLAIEINASSKTLPSQPMGVWGYTASWDTSAVTLETGGNGPQSPPNSLRYHYPIGYPGGAGPARAGVSSRLQTFKNYYVGIYCRWSLPWQNHGSGVNKMFYWGEVSAALLGHATSQFMLNRRGNVIDIVLQWGQSYGSYGSQRNCPNIYDGETRLASTSVGDGNWHLVEFVLTGSTGGTANGSMTVWVDNIKQFELFNCRYAPTGDSLFHGINLDPVWGGVGETKATNDWFEIDHLRVSGTNV